MNLGIDASNIRVGGGLTHLNEILKHARPEKFGIKKVYIWSNNETLNSLPEKDWLVKESHPYLNKSFLWSFFFQIFVFSKLAKKNYQCDVIFAPGSTFLGSFKPFVTMSQNMLPFEFEEAFRFKSWSVRIRFLILFVTQAFTFRRADGIIFLTQYAKNVITKKIRLSKTRSIIIPHGIDKKFSNLPKPQKEIAAYTEDQPFRLLYVSIVTAYKHQWNVAEAVLKLRQEGYPVALDLIGPSTRESIGRLEEILKRDQNKMGAINYLGPVKHNELSEYYKNSDAFIFASTCENMPIILIEAMTAGLPIACSNKEPMPEVLGNAGQYFDPLDVQSIYDCVKELINNNKNRSIIAEEAYKKTINYTWQNCSDATFDFLSNIALKKKIC